MRFVKNTEVGCFPGISVQLFDFDNPVSKVAMASCHSLPASWGAYHLPNDEGTKTMVLRLEDSPFRVQHDWNEASDLPEPDYDVDSEEFRPLDGDVWVFHGTTKEMWNLVKTNPENFVNCLVYHKVDQSKKFSASILALRAEGKY